MADLRIIALALDDRTLGPRSAEIERERQVAIADVIAANRFAPRRPIARGQQGPYQVTLRVEEGRLAIEIGDAEARPLETIKLGLARFRRAVRDYLALLESYFKAVGDAQAAQIETIDMARRSLHNEGATLLIAGLEGKIALDHDTARRLFTLITVLHIRG